MIKFMLLVLKNLRNDAHFQFHTEIRDVLSKFDLVKLRIKEQFDAFLAAYSRVDEALKRINKSAYTAELQDADKSRDDTYIGMTEIARAGLRHFDPEARKAAERLKILFDAYGNVARKPLNEQTSAVYNILQELSGGGKYAADAKLVGIAPWVAALEAHNKTFDALVKSRFDETAAKSDIVLRSARLELDDAYKALRERVEAFMVIDGAKAYEDLVKRANVVIAKYRQLVNAAAGRKSGRQGTGEQGTENGNRDVGVGGGQGSGDQGSGDRGQGTENGNSDVGAGGDQGSGDRGSE